MILITDMTESKYANFDYDLSQKILTLLKVITIFAVCPMSVFQFKCSTSYLHPVQPSILPPPPPPPSPASH